MGAAEGVRGGRFGSDFILDINALLRSSKIPPATIAIPCQSSPHPWRYDIQSQLSFSRSSRSALRIPIVHLCYSTGM